MEIKITHQLIASLAGLSRETVTIQLNRLINEGFLSKDKKTLVIEKINELTTDVR